MAVGDEQERLDLEFPPRHDPYAALRYPDFRRLSIGSFVTSLGTQMLNVAVGWELYERTSSALALGYVGLAQVLPVMLLAFPGGHAADRYDRRRIVLLTQLLLASGSLGLALVSYLRAPLLLFYGCLSLLGIAAAFSGPARSSLLPQTVPEAAFSNAATWSSSSGQLASVIGPALGGLLIALLGSATPIYALDALAALSFVWLVLGMQSKPAPPRREELTVRSLLAGMGFVWRNKVLMAGITLDLFAVLLGGATALLPVYARDILHVGAAGLGWMRAAPSAGAILVAIVLAHRPPFRRAGPALLWAVGGFGLATIVFGLSKNFWLSLSMLALLGGLDGVSVVIRTSLFLLRTPDEMRGRVNAVNGVFISMSNELGGFESGVAAALVGPVVAVAAGGVGTLIVVLLIALAWPEVRRLGALHEP